MEEIDTEFDRKHIWHPYTSMVDPLPCYPVESASGVRIKTSNNKELIDGMSSWWCAIHGYNHPVLNQALCDQASRMSHVMFGGITHAPAVNLCKKLIKMTHPKLDCAFLADSGSVAVEVALKMALQYCHSKGQISKKKFLTIKNGYHGDTFGAMSVCDPVNSMHSLYTSYVPDNLFAEAPQLQFSDIWNESDIESFKILISENYHTIAAVILEPILQGAGGMKIYHPQYLKRVSELCDTYGVLLILDEIATGFGRTGKLFAYEHADICPDILCLGKAITGGYLTLSAVISTRDVADTISLGNTKCFMHGPTFMGNPLACHVANKNLEILEQGIWKLQVKNIERQLESELLPLKDMGYKQVKDVRVLGSIGVVELNFAIDMVASQRQFVDLGVWVRPFRRLIYIMPPYIISELDLSTLIRAVILVVENNFFKNSCLK
ncbi:DEHA2G24750p [Debaryomyces hansenii CBS767]|uniref:DEHA2G24750p n=1 Tax=Debaryomyces hansenii (strain ATCC 36239 / CBS 767 / BCRC 21394 / JCM 1990 / NBRC 0083 / IGC 2968) TaxID=284592 RepID=B5RV04_DEBHA|nr:DEHA2G24750p [Debaryomyces hansenii CBS767]CAR66048.1 DEHA2G24750p [Debaryomyces hansenii CBS767]|eukprot:XP_002777738.1 DEHA2G24750p [Debaryomyces hansenii CBS767]